MDPIEQLTEQLMPTQNLTTRFLDSKKAIPTNAAQIDWIDTKTPGFGIRISKSGTKTAFVRYRIDGRKKRLTLGRLSSSFTLADAREKAAEALSAAHDGSDPARIVDKKKAAATERRRNTFEAVVDDFIDKYAKPRQRTWKETERTLKVNCAEWRKRPFAEITKRDAFELLDGLVSDGKNATANRTLSWLRTLWKWAAKRDIVEAPIMDAVEIEAPERPRNRFYSDVELKKIWRTADRLDAVESAYIKLLILLGVRRTELAGACWAELDDVKSPILWTVPTERTKTSKRGEASGIVYPIPLPPLAQRIIKGLPRTDDNLMFPGRIKSKAIWPGSPLLKKVRELSGVDDFRFHAFRDTVATFLQNREHDEHEIALVLNHAGGGTVTRTYIHSYPLAKKRRMLEAWAEHVESIVAPEDVAVLR